MRDYDDDIAWTADQGNRARKLFAAVVLAALDDAIADHKKYGNGPEQIARWARSRDGREVLTCAGIDPNERVVQGLMEFVRRGVRTSVALSREESERRAQAARDAQEAA
ncbi:MAG: elongation factor P [Alphaproteobacteria bacterium]|nr:MAG: elongation factor P [Alphaproteobacteria bacterium]